MGPGGPYKITNKSQNKTCDKDDNELISHHLQPHDLSALKQCTLN